MGPYRFIPLDGRFHIQDQTGWTLCVVDKHDLAIFVEAAANDAHNRAYAAGLEAGRGTQVVEHDMPRVLDAPCFWCGYNGELYWQAGSHAESCPWRNVGGVVDRTAIIARHYRTLRTEA